MTEIKKKDERKLMPGFRIGRWTVVEEAQSIPRKDGKTERRVLCRCDCGTERRVLERSLLYGGSESCGCLRRELAVQAASHDLTGQRFGQLLVRERVTSGKGGIRWLCRCDCGREYTASGSLLTTGRRTHCGDPKAHPRSDGVDITGQKFHRLTALHPLETRDSRGYVIWHCRCDCGNEIDIPYNTLVHCNMKSCGCRKKEHDRKLNTFLTHVAGTSVDMLKSKKIPTDNTTGYRGVYLIRGKYTAKIVFQKKAYYLGSYDSIEDAAEARKEAEETLFGGAAEHYGKWKSRADLDPAWAQENPIQISVTQNSDKRVSIMLLPVL